MDKHLKTYRDIISKHNLKGVDVCEKIGITYDSYRVATKPSTKKAAKWIKVFNLAYEMGKSSVESESTNDN